MMASPAEEGPADQPDRKDRSDFLTHKVAQLLQGNNPRKEITAGAVAQAAGISQEQASQVLGTFARERTDVVRVRRGVYKYVPGKGKGIKPAPDSLDIEGRAVNNPSNGIRTSSLGGVIKGYPVDAGMTLPVIPREPVPLSFTQVPGLSTADGHLVARDEGGVVYKVVPLS